MTQEDKELLLKDICARLPYELWVDYEGNKYLVTGYAHGMFSLTPSTVSSITGPCPAFTELKPYLRPMSSMTEEELEELNTLTYHNISVQDNALCGYICSGELVDVFDWLNSHHFDYRELIPKGLAIEVTEDNNPYKE